MIGPLELVLLLLIVLLFVGYKWLPGLGRSAGKGVKSVGQGAKKAGTSAQGLIGDKVDPSKLRRSAGEGLREVRELRDAVKGKSEPAKNGATAEEPQSAPTSSGANGTEKPT
jgi:Sec-independent protein translocase protein TatA